MKFLMDSNEAIVGPFVVEVIVVRPVATGGSIESPFRSHPRVYYTSKHTRVYLYEYTNEPDSNSRFCRDCIASLKF